MTQDNPSKAEIAQRAREVRDFADKISALSNDELENIVGGARFTHPASATTDVPEWWLNLIGNNSDPVA